MQLTVEIGVLVLTVLGAFWLVIKLTIRTENNASEKSIMQNINEVKAELLEKISTIATNNTINATKIEGLEDRFDRAGINGKGKHGEK